MSVILNMSVTRVLFSIVLIAFIQSSSGDPGGPKAPEPGAPPPAPPDPSAGSLPQATPTTVDPRCTTVECLTTQGQSSIPFPGDCSKFYKCAGKSDPKEEDCPPNQLFNKYSSQCESTTNRSVCLQCPTSASTPNVPLNPSSTLPSSSMRTTSSSTSTSTLTTTYSSTTTARPPSSTMVRSPSSTTLGSSSTPTMVSNSPSLSYSSTTSTSSVSTTTKVTSTQTQSMPVSSSTILTSTTGQLTASSGSSSVSFSDLNSALTSTSTKTAEFSTTDAVSEISTDNGSSITASSDFFSPSTTTTIFTPTRSVAQTTDNSSSVSASSSSSSTSVSLSAPSSFTTGKSTELSSSFASGATTTSTTTTTTAPSLREIKFFKQPSDPVVEGDVVEFECRFIWKTFQILATLNRFSWILNGKELQPTGRILIVQSTLPSLDGYYISTLRFSPALSSDSGNLTCCGITGKFLNCTSTNVSVLMKPRVSISPPSLSVTSGDNFTLNCSVFNLTAAYPVRLMTWLKDDREVLHTDDFTSTQFPGYSTLSRIAESSMNISCFVETILVNITSRTAFIQVIPKDDAGNTCQPNSASGIDWWLTSANTSQIRPCPDGASGLAVRHCAAANKWDDPDLSDCISKQFVDLMQQIDVVRNRNSPLDNDTMTYLAGNISQIITQTENFTQAELESAIDLLYNMSEMHENGPSDMVLNQKELLEIMTAVNILLDTSVLYRSPEKLIVSLLTAINTYAYLYTKQDQNNAVFFLSQNLILETDGILLTTATADANGTWQVPSWSKLNWTMADANYWTRAVDDVIGVKQQMTSKLLSDPDSDHLNYTSSCIRNLGGTLPLTEDQKINGSYINSFLVSLSIIGIDRSTIFKPPIIISAEHLRIDKNMTGKCVYWNFSSPTSGEWMDDGCQTMSSNDTHTVCNCSHLTNFAILMSPYPATDMDEVVLSIISMVGCIISVISLVLTIILYFSQWKKMKSKRAAVLINLCVALIIANIIFLVGSDKTQSEIGCKVVAAWLHYFFLAAFFLMLLEGIMLLIYVVFVFYVHRVLHTVLLIVAAWVIPAIIVAISLGVTRTNGYGTANTCWLSVDQGVLWAFVGPALFVILVNLIIIIIVLIRIANAKVRSELKRKRNKVLSVLRNVVILSPILGVTWVFGVLSVNEKTIAFQYIFAIANSLQGLFIFVLHGLCHTKNKKSASVTSKQKQRLAMAPSKEAIRNDQIQLSLADSQEELVRTEKPEKQLSANEEITKHNSIISKFPFGHQLSNMSHTSNGTTATYVSNTSTSNGRASHTLEPMQE